MTFGGKGNFCEDRIEGCVPRPAVRSTFVLMLGSTSSIPLMSIPRVYPRKFSVRLWKAAETTY
jgi:hypothetical protein